MTPVEKQRLVLLRLLKEQSLKEVPSEWQNKGENGAFGPSSQLCQIGTSTEGEQREGQCSAVLSAPVRGDLMCE